MVHALSPNIGVADFGDRAVILDLHADRYRLVDGALARTLAELRDGGEPGDNSALERLAAQGILVPDLPYVAPPEPPTLRRCALEIGSPTADLGIALLGFILIMAIIELHRKGLARTLSACSGRMAAVRRDAGEARAVELAQSFAMWRPALPLARSCLRDSLALMRLLSQHSVGAQLVFGVRLDPFAAHCWVQRDDLLLTDNLHFVSEYRPMLVV